MMLQEEPRIVKSHDIHIDADYADWIAEVKHRYRSAQVKAAVKVNAEKLLFNWQLGRDLVQKKAEERWGAGVVEQVSLDLKENYDFRCNFYSYFAKSRFFNAIWQIIIDFCIIFAVAKSKSYDNR